ncbi:MAG: FHA domain-containing protein [Bacteroidales bacterium]|nr:FHA domain-containing protein [Bacteroidales bacterium]
MKLLRIGSSNNCDIIYHNPYVSGIHAELLLTDQGEMFISDKNSMNGTFVGNTRLNPNEETKIQRGDLVRFGDVELNWNHVPSGYGPKTGEVWYNIGTSQRNEIVVSSQFASRYHAIAMVKDKKVFLMDNNSKNGTMLNGVKIAKNKFVRLKKGDNIICGDVDVTEDVKPLFPKSIWKPFLIALASAAVLAGLVLGAMAILGGGNWTKKYAPAVVYVDAAYHYDIVFEDTPISKDVWENVIKTPYGVLTYQDSEEPYHQFSATAFFIDRKGVLATNRHVANPGEYQSDEKKTEVRNAVNEFVTRQIRIEKCKTADDVELLGSTLLGSAIVYQWLYSGNKSISNLNAMIRSMQNAKFTVKSVLDYVTVGYPDRYYTHRDEYERCFVLAVSPTAEKDVALLQLNTKRTPDNIKTVFDVDKMFFAGQYVPLKDRLAWIGYPRGNNWGLDESIHSLVPQVRDTKVSKQPSRFTFEFQGESGPGASGSPIFNTTNGKL